MITLNKCSFKIRNKVFETNSSSTHSISVQKLNDDGRIERNKTVILCEDMYGRTATTEMQKLQFISCVLTALVEDYYDNISREYMKSDNGLYFNNIAFDALKEVLKEERNVDLIYKNCHNSISYDDDHELCSYEVLFGCFDWGSDNLEERYIEYVQRMKPKIKKYIFGNYILSSEVEEW